MILSNSPELEKEIDNADEIKYNFKGKRVSYISYDKIGQDNIRYIRQELTKLYSGEDNAIANGLGIEKDKAIYITDSGKDNGNVNFGVRKTIFIEDDNLRKERLVKINDRAIQNGFISEQLFGKIKHASGNDSRGSSGQQLQEKLSDNNRESPNNKSGVSGTNESGRVRGLKYSLKDSVESDVLKEYGKTYRWSETGYILKDGTKLD